MTADLRDPEGVGSQTDECGATGRSVWNIATWRIENLIPLLFYTTKIWKQIQRRLEGDLIWYELQADNSFKLCLQWFCSPCPCIWKQFLQGRKSLKSSLCLSSFKLTWSQTGRQLLDATGLSPTATRPTSWCHNINNNRQQQPGGEWWRGEELVLTDVVIPVVV